MRVIILYSQKVMIKKNNNLVLLLYDIFKKICSNIQNMS